jgi:hypothetical protein
MNEGGPIVLPQKIFPNLNDEIWTQPDEVPVERGMVQSTQSEPIWHHWFSARVRIWNDMSRIEQFLVAQAAERTLPVVCLKDALSKRSLMQAHPHRGSHVCSARGAGVFSGIRLYGQAKVFGIVHRDRERQVPRVIFDNESRPSDEVLPRDNAV